MAALMAKVEASHVMKVGLAKSKCTRISGELSCDFSQHTASEQVGVQKQGSLVFNSIAVVGVLW